MLMLYLNLSASETKLFALLLAALCLFPQSWLPAAAEEICFTSDFFCELLQQMVYFKKWNLSAKTSGNLISAATS